MNENNFLYSLSDIRKRAFTFLNAEMRKIGAKDIPPSYGDILYAISRRENVCVTDLCMMTNKDKSTVSIIINALEKKGYVIKEKDENDGRSVRVKLSKKAFQLADPMMVISEMLNKKLFSGMSSEEKTIFFMLLNKISSNL